VRPSLPKPPPSVSPATPVSLLTPIVVANPNACVAVSNSPRVRPASARAMRRSGSTSIPFMRDRSITNPPSQTEFPAMLCPPLRTEASASFDRANMTASATSSGPAQYAIRAGFLSTIPFQTLRAPSYSGSVGSTSLPRSLRRKRSTSKRLVASISVPPANGCIRLALHDGSVPEEPVLCLSLVSPGHFTRHSPDRRLIRVRS
jgi:hypothetical protein